MAIQKSEYGNNSLKALKGPDQVRKKPAVIFGTNDAYGAAHGIYEIIANAIDEARAGYGKRIDVRIWNDGTVEVEDEGRGVPMGWNEAEKQWNWELVFCTMYASGKYDSASYGAALGLNGLGATAMQFASEFMEVYSTRDGKTSCIRFEKGLPICKLKEIDPIKEGTGTKIKFKPDAEVFIDTNALPPEHYLGLLRRQAMLHPGLKIVFDHEAVGHPIELCYPEGIKDFIKSICEKPLTKEVAYFEDSKMGTDREEEEEYKFDQRVAFTFSRDLSFLEIYHNGSHLSEGGVTMEAVKRALPAAFSDFAAEAGKIGKSEKFIFRDIESILVLIGDTSAPGHRTYFKNQTKGAINNPFMGKAYADFIYYHTRIWLNKHRDEADKIVSEIIANKTAREEADKVSKKVIQSLSKSVSFGNKPKKFVDCRSKSPFERELFIVEGDSALGACKLSRDANFQAIMPVRGKIINCLKKDLSQILSSDIVVDLLKIFGCGVEAESKFIKDLPKFDASKLNWSKIIICTDADLDGMQIRCLVITLIYRLCPSLLKLGKVYIAETPLFEISYGKDTAFAYTEAEKENFLAKLEAAGANMSRVKIQRSKGLGENDPEMMSKSTMHPLTRRLIPVEFVGDDTDIAHYFDALLGDDIETRRMLIDEYFALTSADID